ncbi:MAG: aminotransferase class V-fold PLP-dependent enzyme [Spirochaetaceae bacterium]|nr:aminotransferase class V-fold PLP-dependent enzyme [Spirochaetaceae bacterium]
MERHYFDWAATAIPDTEIVPPAPFGNPSSKHTEGRDARRALEDARSRCAAALGVKPETLYFTSGGSEANAIALFSRLRLASKSSACVLLGAAEHPSLKANAQVLREAGIPVYETGVEQDGGVSVRTLEKALSSHEDAAFAGVSFVQNETGAISDVESLCRLAHSYPGRPVHFHCDMVQALGKLHCPLAGVDSAAFSAHKTGAPRGVGLLYLKKTFAALVLGGGQERGIRSGTENVAGALSFALTLEKRVSEMQRCAKEASFRMARLIAELHGIERCTLVPACRTCEDARFSPYILQAAFRDIPGEVFSRMLDDAGIAVSTGSACSSNNKSRPSLAAMGVDEKTAFEAVRISQGWSTSDQSVTALISAIKSILQQY